jgi:hypothetical protein
MIAPRKLQSLGAAVQAEAVAESSVRSTAKVVASGITGLITSGTSRKTANGWLEELEEALCVNFKEAQTKTMSGINKQVSFLFIVMLQNLIFVRCCYGPLETGAAT